MDATSFVLTALTAQHLGLAPPATALIQLIALRQAS